MISPETHKRIEFVLAVACSIFFVIYKFAPKINKLIKENNAKKEVPIGKYVVTHDELENYFRERIDKVVADIRLEIKEQIELNDHTVHNTIEKINLQLNSLQEKFDMKFSFFERETSNKYTAIENRLKIIEGNVIERFDDMRDLIKESHKP